MRVEVNTEADFCEELSRGSKLAENSVRVRIDTRASAEDSPYQDIGFWATAVVMHEDGSYILELFRDFGSEDTRYPDIMAATKAAEHAKHLIAKFCESAGFELRHGKWELY